MNIFPSFKSRLVALLVFGAVVYGAWNLLELRGSIRRAAAWKDCGPDPLSRVSWEKGKLSITGERWLWATGTDHIAIDRQAPDFIDRVEVAFAGSLVPHINDLALASLRAGETDFWVPLILR